MMIEIMILMFYILVYFIYLDNTILNTNIFLFNTTVSFYFTCIVFYILDNSDGKVIKIGNLMSINIINNIIVPYPQNIKISQVSVQPVVYKVEWIYNGAPCNVELDIGPFNGSVSLLHITGFQYKHFFSLCNPNFLDDIFTNQKLIPKGLYKKYIN